MKLKICMLVLLLAALLVMSASPAFGQCALCYTSASNASKSSQNALTRAVVVLLIPPVGMMAVLIGVAFRYRSRNDDETGPIEDGSRMDW